MLQDTQITFWGVIVFINTRERKVGGGERDMLQCGGQDIMKIM